ncbi:NAD(P)H-binding protein [Rhodohalobacter sp. 614A]|uniref:NAD(P)H-binding protein n=1 Tax=Rhodohalobacter sp. 614A TaxID=2908649 RepID=UPI001F2839A8|nr:NAD(P)H-binding protein [Rhodohalobacter sp. 614A]
MNIVLTGSLGRIGQPLTQKLLEKNHTVTVISSSPERKDEIEKLGANPAIGNIEDRDFLTKTFTGADVVYLMEPPVNFRDENQDMKTFWTDIAENYKQAVQKSGVQKVVHLSSIGAHTDEGNGMLNVHHHVENILRDLPENVSIKFMRPVGFYYNMYAFIPTIKAQRTIIQNYGGVEKEPWVSPLDIAAVISEEMDTPFEGRTIRYIASDEASPNEVAITLGEAIGIPDLTWTVISDEQFENGLLDVGFSPQAAKGLTEMNAGRRNELYADYNQNKPELGNVKLTDFAKDFAAVYHKS